MRSKHVAHVLLFARMTQTHVTRLTVDVLAELSRLTNVFAERRKLR
jgi:hypothetical protein